MPADEVVGAFGYAVQIPSGRCPLAVVAAALESHLAGEHLGRLATQAPTLSFRVSAVNRALALWYADPAAERAWHILECRT